MKRPIFVAIIGYILGIIVGLYLHTSIVPFCICIVATPIIYKKITKKKKSNKLKLFSIIYLGWRCLSTPLRISCSGVPSGTDYMLAFNADIFLFFNGRFRSLFRNGKLQSTIFEFGFNVILFYTVAYVEGSGAGATVTFLTDVLAIFVFLVLVGIGHCIDGKVTIFQLSLNVFFLHSWQVHGHLITILGILHICGHQTRGVIIQTLKRILKEIIKISICKNARHQHKSYLLSGSGSKFFLVSLFICSIRTITLIISTVNRRVLIIL